MYSPIVSDTRARIPLSGNMQLHVVNDNGKYSVYLCAVGGAGTWKKDSTLVGHAAGTWMVDHKAKKFLEEAGNSEKSHVFKVTSDQDWVMYEASTSVETLMPLRTLIKKLESDGIVDLTLGGHEVKRDPQALAADADVEDHFLITEKPDAMLLWRVNSPGKTVKASNLASILPASALENSCVRRIWKMKLFPNEKLLAPAKPCWHLMKDVELKEGHCLRII